MTEAEALINTPGYTSLAKYKISQDSYDRLIGTFLNEMFKGTPVEISDSVTTVDMEMWDSLEEHEGYCDLEVVLSIVRRLISGTAMPAITLG